MSEMKAVVNNKPDGDEMATADDGGFPAIKEERALTLPVQLKPLNEAEKERETSKLLTKPQVNQRERRKSPVTVQEWVASLPPPHLLQRRELLLEESK